MIEILSRKDAAAVIAADPDRPIIAIGESNGQDVEEKIVRHANNCLCLKFDDIETERLGYVTVSEDQIRQAIEWAKDKDCLIVACRVGVSRSSALAYVIEASKHGPEEAIKILDMSVHQPNRLVVKLGTSILGEKFNEVYESWMKELYKQYL